jgi:HlyD family secretion protein
MDGVVSQLISELGERVSGSSFMQGTEIMTVADLSMMEARVDIGENDVVLIKFGDTARVQVDAYANRKFKGTVTEIANTATTKGAGSQDEVTNFQVKIRILDKDAIFRPGMSMSADVETETKKNVLSIPIQSVTTRVLKSKEGEKPKQGDSVANAAAKGTEAPHADKPKEVVFVIDNGKVKALPVKRGISDDVYVEILEGVTDQLEVVSGSFKAINRDLEDGSLVKVDNAQKRFGMAKKEN